MVRSVKGGGRWKGLRHKLGWNPKIIYTANRDLQNGELVSFNDVRDRRIDWPWFHFMKSRNTYGLEGVLIPRRFGRAYFEFDTDCDVFYIIPVNLIVAFYRAASLRIRWIWSEQLQKYEAKVADVTRSRIKDTTAKSYDLGYKFGYDMGYIDGMKEGDLRFELALELNRKRDG